MSVQAALYRPALDVQLPLVGMLSALQQEGGDVMLMQQCQQLYSS